MNPDALASINDAVKDASSTYGQRFRELLTYDTSTSQSARESNIEIANGILDRMESFLNPDIMVLDRAIVEQFPLRNGDCFAEPKRSRLLDEVRKNVRFVKRSLAETSESLVQVISASVFVHSNKIFLFQRPEADPKYQLYGKSSIWQGAHVEFRAHTSPDEMMKRALSNRIQEKLFLSREFETSYLGCCWDAGSPESARHLGLLFKSEIDSDDVANDLEKKEFRSGRGFGLYGQFFAPEQLGEVMSTINLEPWSLALLESGFAG